MTGDVSGSAVGELPDHLRRVHMVGIGGAGMSGLARILLARGSQVSGSDAKSSRGILALRTRGALIQVGHDPSALDQIPGGPSVVVTTHAAIPKTNPELVAARSRRIPILLRPHVLAELMVGYRSVLIAGTHGKTSTTSMTVVALQHCGLDPSFAIGGELNESGTNAHHGSGSVFVAEADESDGSLLEYVPDIVVVTNIEVDHLDFFGTVERYVAVFDEFVARIKPGGSLVVCLDDPGACALARRHAASLTQRGVSVLGYGAPEVEVPDGVRVVATMTSWTPTAAGSEIGVRFGAPVVDPGAAVDSSADRSVALTIPGIHMARNAIAAIVAATRAGGDLSAVIAGIEAFAGVRRRFEFKGRVSIDDGGVEGGGVDDDSAGQGSAAGGVVEVFDDYAHHPTEVTAVLTAARAMVDGDDSGRRRRVVAVFQPHLYSRTEEFADEFAAALDLADAVVVADVYGAREQPVPGVSGRMIVERMTRAAHFEPDLSALATTVAGLVRPGDVVLTLGAGDITMQGPEILAALAHRASGGDRGADAGGTGGGER
ncbi:UDP-N-acetylmuramate--L-alanine ligase [Gordonia polyisoprenivorans]|uniref:UDP-N-acetylmuramate--L-alanine ligase n=1 Tax=Gordonia polyisoprenivorans TaxID=84595 RepID=UPI0022345655|nr:UDP-N-acetylmuramate--L-alanine ligase [uncultured Gordonia sp.]UZF54205.1 UDP-N-acetylmuramate--L-alanine ligase [Gordonia polyisoprenivorans]